MQKSMAKLVSKMLLLRMGELLLVVGLVAIIAWLTGQIQDMRRDLIQTQLSLEGSLDNAVKLVELRAQVKSQEKEIGAIRSLVPDRNSIGEVVSAIEAEARHHDVSLTIPTVGAVKVEAEEETDRVAQFKTVNLQVVAIGSVSNDMNFFHAVEHLPYILQVTSWNLTKKVVRVVPGSVALSPITPGEGQTEAPDAEANLTMQITLTISNGTKN